MEESAKLLDITVMSPKSHFNNWAIEQAHIYLDAFLMLSQPKHKVHSCSNFSLETCFNTNFAGQHNWFKVLNKQGKKKINHKQI